MHVKQEVLADALGITQQSISLLENKETIDEGLLAEIAKTLKFPVEAIKNFNEEATINIIASNNNGSDNSSAVNFQCTFNPIEKWIEALDENKKLYAALLKEKDEKIAFFERLLSERKK